MILKNGTVFYKNEFKKLDIEIRKEYIYKIKDEIKGENEIDITGLRVIPGVIDIHTHGCMGYDFTRVGKREINNMLEYYIKNGITSILATVMTDNESNLKNAMINIGEFINSNENISKLIPINNMIKGINLEGPFFGVGKKGAHDEKYLRKVEDQFFNLLNYASGNNIKIVSIDPDLQGAQEFISKYKENLVISLGHTSCNYNTGLKAVESGANHVTHLFNAMNGIHHRNSGLVGVFSDSNITAELICDGIHIDESVIRMVYKIAGDRIIIISDSILPTGLSNGAYISGGLEIEVDNAVASLPDGTIAGSVINCFEGMKNAIKFGIPEEKAILSATIVPAKVIGVDNQIGSIEDGKRCDIVVIDDEYNIVFVMKDGIVIENTF